MSFLHNYSFDPQYQVERTIRIEAMVFYQLLLTTSNTLPTMTGMALDSIKQKTQTKLTTSFGTKGIQKSSFLDVFPLETNPSDAHAPTPVMTLPCNDASG